LTPLPEQRSHHEGGVPQELSEKQSEPSLHDQGHATDIVGSKEIPKVAGVPHRSTPLRGSGKKLKVAGIQKEVQLEGEENDGVNGNHKLLSQRKEEEEELSDDDYFSCGEEGTNSSYDASD
jgi:hypothetical protein